MNRDTYEEEFVRQDATMEQFATCNCPELEAYVLVRNNKYQVKGKLPNKGKLADALAGENNLIKLCYDSQMMDNFIE